MDVVRMVRLSRDTMANIRQNVTIALGLKAAFLVTTILGVTGHCQVFWRTRRGRDAPG
ncbi:hypothetical protein ACFOYU_14530 [Microvirga sp. GCM10011540]|uniref:hypothetical protein n=1 Tax=Microvirga sp. GCM10011540 TaxID=3317338 RepID=UPI00361B5FF7